MKCVINNRIISFSDGSLVDTSNVNAINVFSSITFVQSECRNKLFFHKKINNKNAQIFLFPSTNG